jgi:hypothetical protein
MSEKKWFIYVGDHHEGPFTVEEIWGGIDGGRFARTGFVWCEGMKDWLALATLPDFERSAPSPPAVPKSSHWQVESPTGTTEVQVEAGGKPISAESAPIPEMIAEPTLETRSPAAVEAEPIREPSMAAFQRENTMTDVGAKTSIIEIASLESATQPQILRPALLGAASATRPSTQGPGEKAPIITKRMKPFIYAVVVIFAIVGLQKTGILRPVEDRIFGMLSTLPELNDVSPEDYLELKKVAKAPISSGPQVSIALSKADPLSPIFYVSTNLPDGARFEIYIEGIPHRLLNTLSFSGKLDVSSAKRLAKSIPLRYPDGKPVPRGEYFVYVMEAPVGQPDLVYKELLPLAPIARNLPNQLPQDRRLVFSKKIYFGTKDPTFEQRLKVFHDGLVDRAKSEAMELSQAVATLDSQALVSTSTYDRLRKQPIGPKQKAVWNDMNRTWRPIEGQITQKYAGMSPESIKEGFFHANLVSEFLVVEKILNELHSAQEKLFTTSATSTSLESEVADLRNQFEGRKTAWKGAIDRALANPANSETGLPVAVTIEGSASKATAPASTPAGGNGHG